MNGGEIIHNTGTLIGGGVVSEFSLATFNMNGGEISGNIASNGGGVYVLERSTFNMSGGDISDNVKSDGGGGVHNNNSVFNMSGDAVIRDNVVTDRGAGIYNDYYSEFNMTGGTISGNIANYGGGIYNSGLSTVDITGGEINGNKARNAESFYLKGSGGGIFTEEYTNLTVGNGAVFSGNNAPTLRIGPISPADLSVYQLNITAVVLDTWVDAGQEAPAYNNFDINCSGNVFVVFIDIEPNGSGSVSVSDSADGTVYGTLTEDGYVYVPITADPITISASPKDVNEFIEFVINGGPGIDDDTAVIQISGHMEIVAYFTPYTPPEYTITATADDGSTITPNGDVKVTHENDITFVFSPKQGYQITAVFVDGQAISPTDLASGKYTFPGVVSNHTIRVESKADNGNGGTGTGPGGNNGGGTGSDGGDGETGSGGGDGETDSEGDGGTASAGSGEWAVLNLVCAILALITGSIAFIAGIGRSDGNSERRSKTSFILKAAALIIGVVTVIVFFTTEQWSLPVTPIDGWTPLMFILFLAVLVLTMISFRFEGGKRSKAER